MLHSSSYSSIFFSFHLFSLQYLSKFVTLSYYCLIFLGDLSNSISFCIIILLILLLNSSIKGLLLYPLSLTVFLNFYTNFSIVLFLCFTFFSSTIFANSLSPLLNSFFSLVRKSPTVRNSNFPFSKSFKIFFFQIFANSSCTYVKIHYTCFFTNTLLTLLLQSTPPGESMDMGKGYDDMIGCAVDVSVSTSCSRCHNLAQSLLFPLIFLMYSSWTSCIYSIDTYLYSYALPLISISFYFLKSLPQLQHELKLKVITTSLILVLIYNLYAVIKPTTLLVSSSKVDGLTTLTLNLILGLRVTIFSLSYSTNTTICIYITAICLSCCLNYNKIQSKALCQLML